MSTQIDTVGGPAPEPVQMPAQMPAPKVEKPRFSWLYVASRNKLLN